MVLGGRGLKGWNEDLGGGSLFYFGVVYEILLLGNVVCVTLKREAEASCIFILAM